MAESQFEIQSEELLDGVRKFENDLRQHPNFKGVEFIKWTEIKNNLEVILAVEVSKIDKTGLIEFSSRYQDTFYHYPLNLNTFIEQDREKLLQYTLTQIDRLNLPTA
jgi:hypothetical protein